MSERNGASESAGQFKQISGVQASIISVGRACLDHHPASKRISAQSLPETDGVLCPPGTHLFRGPFFALGPRPREISSGHCKSFAGIPSRRSARMTKPRAALAVLKA